LAYHKSLRAKAPIPLSPVSSGRFRMFRAHYRDKTVKILPSALHGPLVEFTGMRIGRWSAAVPSLIEVRPSRALVVYVVDDEEPSCPVAVPVVDLRPLDRRNPSRSAPRRTPRSMWNRLIG
jgi:hypothetical protein